MPDDGRRFELIDGELYVNRRPSFCISVPLTGVPAADRTPRRSPPAATQADHHRPARRRRPVPAHRAPAHRNPAAGRAGRPPPREQTTNQPGIRKGPGVQVVLEDRSVHPVAAYQAAILTEDDEHTHTLARHILHTVAAWRQLVVDAII